MDLQSFFQGLDQLEKSKTKKDVDDKDKKRVKQVDLRFEFLEVGKTGELDVNIFPENYKNTLEHVSTSNVLPLPEQNSTFSQIQEKYLDLETNAADLLMKSQKWWPRDLPIGVPNEKLFFDKSLFHISPSPSVTTLEVVTGEATGEVLGFKEVKIPELANQTAQKSTSLLRQPGAREDFTRGNTSNVPFMPGGIDKVNKRILDQIPEYLPMDAIFPGENELLSIPPGFNDRVKFDRMDFELEQVIGEQVYQDSSLDVGLVANPTDLLAPYAIPISDIPTTQESYFKQTPQEVRAEQKRQQILSLQDVFKDIEEDDTPVKNKEESSDDEEEEEENSQEVSKPVVDVPAEKEKPIKRSDSLDNILTAENQDWLSVLSEQRRKQASRKKGEDWAVMESMDMYNFEELVPELAMEFPFDLDQFQKEAIYHLENQETVFVAAHTSAGKTVVAEYAIALAKKHMTRTIYTSPIKALSNQKFRDFKEKFGDVGLITGDVSINPEAACLIMTTEILRSMLYRGADLIRDVEWVIFDEVHYVNDLERGVVWEEVIIMLPAHVNLILLSATVPNTYEFADWIGRTKKKRIYVISTMKRPVPLEHYLYTAGEINKIVDSKGAFLNLGYQAAANIMKEKKEKSKGKISTATQRVKSEQSEWNKLINLLKEKSLLPVVVFTFSKKKCEEFAYGLTGVDLTTSQEKSLIHVFIEESLSKLKGNDRKLPQVLRIKDLLKRGLGVHHGGLLPLVKEVVEILFSRGLVKVLFATETFAMGVNMPARTVVFSSTSKHDGRNFRDLLSGEYIQMSGRAGRRGLDSVGVVIICAFNEVPEAGSVRTMILGKATKLESQFRLTYNMILNLLRVQDFKVEDMIKRSFSEFSSQKLAPQQQEFLMKAQSKLESLEKIECIFGEPDIENYHKVSEEHRKLEEILKNTILTMRQGQQALVPGRVVIINTDKFPNSLATIIRSEGKEAKQFSMLVMCDKNAKTPKKGANLPTIRKGNDWEIARIDLQDIQRICKQKLKIDVTKLIEKPDKLTQSTTCQQLLRLAEESPTGPPEVDPIKELKINDLDFAEKYSRKNNLALKMVASKCHTCQKLDDQFALMDKHAKLKKSVNALKFALSDENLLLMPEFQTRLNVLEKLHYIDSDKTVLLKGRVAREINTVTDELIATELIFENVLTPLNPAEIVALLSCLLFEEKETAEPTLTEKLEQAKEQLFAIATSLANIQIEQGLSLTISEYLKANINIGLMEVVYEWARGMPFSDITQLTEVLEGSIVRTIVRLDETCREVRNAARVIGDTSLYIKMEQASQLIKRDIVFASSLYVQ